MHPDRHLAVVAAAPRPHFKRAVLLAVAYRALKLSQALDIVRVVCDAGHRVKIAAKPLQRVKRGSAACSVPGKRAALAAWRKCLRKSIYVGGQFKVLRGKSQLLKRLAQHAAFLSIEVREVVGYLAQRLISVAHQRVVYQCIHIRVVLAYHPRCVCYAAHLVALAARAGRICNIGLCIRIAFPCAISALKLLPALCQLIVDCFQKLCRGHKSFAVALHQLALGTVQAELFDVFDYALLILRAPGLGMLDRVYEYGAHYRAIYAKRIVKYSVRRV